MNEGMTAAERGITIVKHTRTYVFTNERIC